MQKIKDKSKSLAPRIQSKQTNHFSSIKMVPEDTEDMWHAYNLISIGDLVTGSTIRKVMSENFHLDFLNFM